MTDPKPFITKVQPDTHRTIKSEAAYHGLLMGEMTDVIVWAWLLSSERDRLLAVSKYRHEVMKEDEVDDVAL